MSISIYTLFMAFLWSNVFIFVAAVLRRQKPTHIYVQFLPLLFILILGVARLFIPVEIPYTTVVPSTVIMLKVLRFFRIPVLHTSYFVVHVYTLLFVVWVVGALVSFRKVVLGYVYFQKAMRYQTESEDSRVVLLIGKILARSKSRAKVKVIQTYLIDTPMVAGFFKPVIYLPDIDFTDTELEYVLWHEWMHYVHKDIWIKLFIHIICAVCWWNPFIHILKHDVNHILELKNDLHLTKRLNLESRMQYLETLLKVAKHLSSGKKQTQNYASASISFVRRNQEEKLKQRFQLVHDYKPMNLSQKLTTLCACMLMFSVFAVSFLFVLQPDSDNPPDPEGYNIFKANEEESYLMINDDGTYAWYMEGVYVGDIQDNSKEPFSLFPIKSGTKQ